MSYTSFVYLVLVSASVLFYYVFPKKLRWMVLLAANMVFYIWSGWDNFVFLVVSVLISYFTALKMARLFGELKRETAEKGLDKKQIRALKERNKKQRRKYLVAGLVGVLGLLACVKYTNFILKNICGVIRLFQPEQKTIMLKLIVPMGISFYTFQMVSYLVDVYKGKVQAQTDFCRYMTYASFFPSVVQGPIPRYNELGTQLYEGHEFRFENIRNGALLVLWGFFKKLVLAERLNLFVSEVYGNYASYEGLILVLATVAYSIQIYADFSGCMDIVSGTAKMFGIELAPNFLRPYFSKTLPEFWRRWHVTMGTWFKDYVFYQISISKFSLKLNKNARKVFGSTAGRIISSSFPILVVWFLTGIWHGSSWNFVAWGLFHGCLIMLSQIFTPFNENLTRRLHIRRESFGFRMFQMVRTFALCCVGRVFFRANGLKQAVKIFIHMFSGAGLQYVGGGQLFAHGLNVRNMVVVAVAVFVLWAVSMLQERMNVTEALFRRNIIVRWGLIYLLLLAVVVFGKYGPGYDAAGFIYENF